jgi:D-methionine transport system ATP-binding protein
MGNDISHLEGERLRNFRKNIGMVFQHFNLLTSRTVAGNIAFALEVAQVPKVKREARVNELLSLVGLSHKRDAYPAQLSGGEKQRVGIARALANQPDVLFCDEATSALDPKTTREILHLLKELNQSLGITIILITHEMEVIKGICNKVAVLNKGEIIEQGDIAHVFSDPQHPMTKNLLQSTAHDIPRRFFQNLSPSRKLLRLSFKGDAAGQPVISQMIKAFDVDANILLGWLDHLQTAVIGTLIIELSGEPEQIRKALEFLEGHCIGCEVIER